MSFRPQKLLQNCVKAKKLKLRIPPLPETPIPSDFTNGDQLCYLLFLGFSLLFAFYFGSCPHFRYLKPEGREEAPFCTCGHWRLSQNSILNSHSPALLHTSGWKTKAQMSQILLQFKFHTSSFHQSDTWLSIVKKENTENISAISLSKVNSAGVWLVCGLVPSPVGTESQVEASTFWRWSGLDDCGPQTNSSSASASCSVSWSSLSSWGPFHPCTGCARQQTKPKLCSAWGDPKGERLQKTGL